MQAYCAITSHIRPMFIVWPLFFVLLTACSQSTNPAPIPSTKTPATPTATVVPRTTPKATSTNTPAPAPRHFNAHLILQGVGRPDDLAFDQQGNLLFSDEFNKTIGRVNANGSATILLRDPNGPEGLIVLADGTIIFAEQDTNRIVTLAPGAKAPAVLRTLPGIPSNATCKHGVDGIALDATTNTIIVPDSPTGEVYRMSLDGKTFTKLSSGIVRPTGAGVDSQGNIFIADECGNAIWSITPTGKAQRFGGFGMPDDVVPDGHGNVLVIDLAPAIHSLIRFNPSTGQRETLASAGYIEPQGLVVDTHGNIFVSDDYANIIMEYTPA